MKSRPKTQSTAQSLVNSSHCKSLRELAISSFVTPPTKLLAPEDDLFTATKSRCNRLYHEAVKLVSKEQEPRKSVIAEKQPKRTVRFADSHNGTISLMKIHIPRGITRTAKTQRGIIDVDLNRAKKSCLRVPYGTQNGTPVRKVTVKLNYASSRGTEKGCVADRNLTWQRKVREKVKIQQEEKKGKELEECTFKPTITPRSASSSLNNS